MCSSETLNAALSNNCHADSTYFSKHRGSDIRDREPPCPFALCTVMCATCALIGGCGGSPRDILWKRQLFSMISGFSPTKWCPHPVDKNFIFPISTLKIAMNLCYLVDGAPRRGNYFSIRQESLPTLRGIRGTPHVCHETTRGSNRGVRKAP